MQIVGRRISEVASSKSAVLDLSSFAIEKLPPKIFESTSIQKLNLSNNKLTYLPEVIKQLKNINYLYLGGNHLKELPKSIGVLNNLLTVSLSRNELISLPESIGQLSRLKKLFLWSNHLADLPISIGMLTELQEILLMDNQLTSLPESIGQLSNLELLDLTGNQLTSLPENIGQLSNLALLNLKDNQLTSLPDSIGQLSNLEFFDLTGNQLTSLPDSIGQLSNLARLNLTDNQLTSLPDSIGQLTKLERLHLSENPNLHEPPQEIINQGLDAIRIYLQSPDSSPQWRGKLVILGKGSVGKSQMLSNLQGKGFDENIHTTHMIDIQELHLSHTEREDIKMRLTAWDFGGQDIYYATHQFYVSDDAIYLLTWNPVMGYEQCEVENYLKLIHYKAPNAPVILVATHADEGRSHRVPKKAFTKANPNLIPIWPNVSNTEGSGFDELLSLISDVAVGLPDMGRRRPKSWQVADEVLQTTVNQHMRPEELFEMLVESGLSSAAVIHFVRSRHKLGELLFYENEPVLKDYVFLKPQWIAKHITRVLDSLEVANRDGILTREHMHEIWRDLPEHLHEYFLQLMEAFDLSYRTLVDDEEISYIVEKLPKDPIDYEEEWDKLLLEEHTKEISVKYSLNVMPPGIPTWFIARSHRFSLHLHWRYGALLEDAEGLHRALIESDLNQKIVHLTVRGPHPNNFLSVLMDGFQDTLGRYKYQDGLVHQKSVFCSCQQDTEPCGHYFNYDNVRKSLDRPDKTRGIMICEATGNEVSSTSLLFGIDLRSEIQKAVLDKLTMVEDQLSRGQKELAELSIKIESRTGGKLDTIKQEIIAQRAEIKDLRALAQRNFTSIFRYFQENVDSACPNVFVLYPKAESTWQKVLHGETYFLHLYCQAPGYWHPTNPEDGGQWTMTRPIAELRWLNSYIIKMLDVLKTVTPFVGPWIKTADLEYEKMVSGHVKMMNEYVKLLPGEFYEDHIDIIDIVRSDNEVKRVIGDQHRALRELLQNLDDKSQWGLRQRITLEGHILWLCPYHDAEFMEVL